VKGEESFLKDAYRKKKIKNGRWVNTSLNQDQKTGAAPKAGKPTSGNRRWVS